MTSAFPGSIQPCLGLDDEVVRVLEYLISVFSETNGVAAITVLSCLFGAVSTLAVMSTFLLVRKGVSLRSVQILLCATVALYTSTCVYFGYTQYMYSTWGRTLVYAGPYLNGNTGDSSLGDAVNQYSYTMTAQTGALAGTLVVNMLISDMIVWWRAIIIWPRNKLVLGVGIFLLVTTGVLAIVTTYQNMPQGYSTLPSSKFSALFQAPQAMAFDPIGLACAVFSLATNVTATALIGYKAWIHRRTMRKYQTQGNATKSHALNMLMFIVESGVGYCLLWALSASYFAVTLKPWNIETDTDKNYIAFMDGFALACLVPLVAMYPMVIIVIVTINQSPIDRLYASLRSN